MATDVIDAILIIHLKTEVFHKIQEQHQAKTLGGHIIFSGDSFEKYLLHNSKGRWEAWTHSHHSPSLLFVDSISSAQKTFTCQYWWPLHCWGQSRERWCLGSPSSSQRSSSSGCFRQVAKSCLRTSTTISWLREPQVFLLFPHRGTSFQSSCVPGLGRPVWGGLVCG